MRTAKIFVDNREAGILSEVEFLKRYTYEYLEGYAGEPISLTLPLSEEIYEFDFFPPFFEGLLPEGYQLDGLLESANIDRQDHMSQLLAVGGDLVGNVTVEMIQQ